MVCGQPTSPGCLTRSHMLSPPVLRPPLTGFPIYLSDREPCGRANDVSGGTWHVSVQSPSRYLPFAAAARVVPACLGAGT